jgi:replicative DNA helicase
MRLLSSEAEVDSRLIRTGQAYKNKGNIERLAEAALDLGNTKIFIDDTSGVQIGEIKNKCRRIKSSKGKLDLIVIDYLQLMDFGGVDKDSKKPENRQQEIATLTRMLKQLARDMECPVLVLSQMTREVDKRSNKVPVLSDLRESGAIEQDADMVMFIYKEAEKNDGEGPDVNLTRTLFIAKHRNGETGPITLRWLQEYTKFAHYDQQADILANL